MTISAEQAAVVLIDVSGSTLSTFRLQGTLYITSIIYLGIYNEPLIHECFRATSYGPLISRLYRAFTVFGAEPVSDIFDDVPLLKEGSERNELVRGYKELARYSDAEIITYTHRVWGPWSKNYIPKNNIENGPIIPQKDLLIEYEEYFTKLKKYDS